MPKCTSPCAKMQEPRSRASAPHLQRAHFMSGEISLWVCVAPPQFLFPIQLIEKSGGTNTRSSRSIMLAKRKCDLICSKCSRKLPFYGAKHKNDSSCRLNHHWKMKARSKLEQSGKCCNRNKQSITFTHLGMNITPIYMFNPLAQNGLMGITFTPEAKV